MVKFFVLDSQVRYMRLFGIKFLFLIVQLLFETAELLLKIVVGFYYRL